MRTVIRLLLLVQTALCQSDFGLKLLNIGEKFPMRITQPTSGSDRFRRMITGGWFKGINNCYLTIYADENPDERNPTSWDREDWFTFYQYDRTYVKRFLTSDTWTMFSIIYTVKSDGTTEYNYWSFSTLRFEIMDPEPSCQLNIMPQWVAGTNDCYYQTNSNLRQYGLYYYLDYSDSLWRMKQIFRNMIIGPVGGFNMAEVYFYKSFSTPKLLIGSTEQTIWGVRRRIGPKGLMLIDQERISLSDVVAPEFLSVNGETPINCYTVIGLYKMEFSDYSKANFLLKMRIGSDSAGIDIVINFNRMDGYIKIDSPNANPNYKKLFRYISGLEDINQLTVVFSICATRTSGWETTLRLYMNQKYQDVIQFGWTNTVQHSWTSKASFESEFVELRSKSNHKSTVYLLYFRSILGGLHYRDLTYTPLDSSTEKCLVASIKRSSASKTGFEQYCLVCKADYTEDSTGSCPTWLKGSAAITGCLRQWQSICIQYQADRFYDPDLFADLLRTTIDCTSTAIPPPVNTNTLIPGDQDSYFTDKCVLSSVSDPCSPFQDQSGSTCSCKVTNCDPLSCNISPCSKCNAGYFLRINLNGTTTCDAIGSPVSAPIQNLFPPGWGPDMKYSAYISEDSYQKLLLRPCATFGCIKCPEDYLTCTECDPVINKLCVTTCSSPCAGCIGNFSTRVPQCTSCPSNLFFSSGTYECLACATACTNANLSCSTLNRNDCCHSSCLTCNGTSNTNCLTCDSNNKPVYFLNNECKPCPVQCGTCDATEKCLTCAAGYYVNKFDAGNGSICVLCTGVGEVIHSQTKECTNCNSKCSACSGSKDFCTNCYGQYALFPNNTCDTCVEPKERMFYDEFNFACKFCQPSCYNCSKSATNCTSCISNYLLILADQTTNSWACTPCTTDGYYKNMQDANKPICAKCNSTCTTCSDGSTCTQCIAGLYRTVENYCVDCTQDGFYKTGGLCLACDSTCLTCVAGSPASCSSCTPDRYLMPSNTCIVRQPLKLIQTRFEADLNLVTFSFDQPVQWAQGTSESDYAVVIVKDSIDSIEALFSPDSVVSITDKSGLSVCQTVTNEKLELQGSTLRISLKFSDTTKAATIAVVMKSKYLLQKSGDPTVAINSRIFAFAPIDYIYTNMDKAMESAKAPARAAVTSITTILFIISIPQALVLMKVFQTIDYYIYIDCDYPTNFSKFLEMISKNILDMLPNIFEVFSDDEGKPVYNRFSKFGLNIHFMKNSGVQLSILLLIGVSKLLFLGLHKALPKVKWIESTLI
jgi:hypothetical protein